MLPSPPSIPALPELGSWASDLARRLEALHSMPPLVPTGVRRVGTLMSLPGPLEEEDNPVLFWRGTQLCVRQEMSDPPSMRCLEERARRWGKEEPYSSPFEGWRVELDYRGRVGLYQTTVWSIDPEGTKEDLGNWSDPVVVARGPGTGVVVVSREDPRNHGGLKEFDLSSGSGSLLAGRGRYYFSKPDELRSLKVQGQAWKFILPGPQGEVRCAAHPLVSPNGRWAACPAWPVGAASTPDAGTPDAGTPDADTPSGLDLFLFGLAPRAQ